MDRERTLDALESGALSFQIAYAGATQNPMHIENDCVWCRASVPFPAYGGVLRHRFSSSTAEHRIGEVLKIIEGDPIWWVTPRSTPADLGKLIESRGGKLGAQLKGMGADMGEIADAPELPKSIEIRRADDDDLVEQYARVYPLLFSAPLDGWHEGVVDAELALIRSKRDPFHRWIALEDGKAICAGMTQRVGDVAILQTLCTLPERRSQGIGAALMSKAMAAEQEAGCTSAALWAGPGADPFYERCGFQHVGNADLYILTAAQPAERDAL
jgi:GNAT superfamily N-acetyltransferase